MTVGSVQSAAAMGIDWVGSPRTAAPASPERADAVGGRLDRQASDVQDRVEFSSQGLRRSQGRPDEGQEREIRALEAREKAVKAHEQAHASAGAGVVRGGAKYGYETGPDGKRYVTSGEVQVGLETDPARPARTLQQAEQVRRAALAPADPSPQDRDAAAQAAQAAVQAREELARQAQAPPQDEASPRGEERRDRASIDGIAAYARSAAPVRSEGRSWVA